MKITTTITISVSPENASLVPYLVSRLGGKQEGETDVEAIKRIRNTSAFDNAYSQIVNHLYPYFGEKERATAEALDDLLKNGAIEVETSVV